jgi:adenylosuccinate synthase
MPDLFKLAEEVEGFAAQGGRLPKIMSAPDCPLTYIDDILINMSLEVRRGDKRHGSCGMGIDEAKRRSSVPDFKITPHDICSGTAEGFLKKLQFLRDEYLPSRLEVLNLDPSSIGEYGEMLQDPNVLYNYCEQMCRNSELITIVPESAVKTYDDIIFEGAQGLILDEENLAFAPNLTSSRTGLTNPAAFLKKLEITTPGEAIYVTRTYVTKHGAGRFPYEDEKLYFDDKTNIHNEWQGTIRFATHGSEEEFNEYVIRDIEGTSFVPALFLTHVNETADNVLTRYGAVFVKEWISRINTNGLYDRFLISDSRFAEEIRTVQK